MNLLAIANSLPGDTLSITGIVLLVLAVGLALSFEFVNGFHDTANAVATVIYTHSLPPWVAVIWSGFCNLLGVLTWGYAGTVAFSILGLLPTELMLNIGSGAGFAMIFALLTSAILWNLGTWYLGLPASSSHTLVGSILGVGLANALMSGHTVYQGVNWVKVKDVFVALLVSPVFGFVLAGGLLLLLKAVIPNKKLFTAPEGKTPPPWRIRGTLILTCTGVSFFHGSNDGQKGMGLLLLILIGILPAEYALNLNASRDDLRKLESTAALVQPMLDSHSALTAVSDLPKPPAENIQTGTAKVLAEAASTDSPAAGELSRYLENGSKINDQTFPAVSAVNRELVEIIQDNSSLANVPAGQRKLLRKDLYLVNQTLDKMLKTNLVSTAEKAQIGEYHQLLDSTTKFIPLWVKFAVALSLGCGTMVGWKRIVTTVGEKIGKDHLTYGQGMAAEIVAMATIAAADGFGLPVSTTHVLSSGIAGTMAANQSGLQAATLRNILLAWVLTLPVCVLLGAGLFAAGLMMILNSNVAIISAIGAAAIALLVICWRLGLLRGKREPRLLAASAV